MARLIDADALLETVEDHVTTVSCCPTVDWSMGKTQMKKQVIEDIRNAQTISVWISVKDRLPKTEQKVLVSIKTAYGTRCTTIAAHVGYHERNSESDGWSLDCEIDWEEYDEENDVYWVPECWYEVNFVDDNPNWIIDKVDGEITHWMPLPSTEGLDGT